MRPPAEWSNRQREFRDAAERYLEELGWDLKRSIPGHRTLDFKDLFHRIGRPLHGATYRPGQVEEMRVAALVLRGGPGNPLVLKGTHYFVLEI
jgi:hypothetical protein